MFDIFVQIFVLIILALECMCVCECSCEVDFEVSGYILMWGSVFQNMICNVKSDFEKWIAGQFLSTGSVIFFITHCFSYIFAMIFRLGCLTEVSDTSCLDIFLYYFSIFRL